MFQFDGGNDDCEGRDEDEDDVEIWELETRSSYRLLQPP